MNRFPLKGSSKSPIIMKGIYSFVQNNKELICTILTNTISFDEIVNYKNNDYFNIVESAHNRFEDHIFLRIETRNFSSSQGHCNVYDDDKIFYINECTVMNIVINLYKKELRVDKLNSLLKD